MRHINQLTLGLFMGLILSLHYPLNANASRVRPMLPTGLTFIHRTTTHALFSPTEFYQTVRQYPDLIKLAHLDTIGMLRATLVQPGLQTTLTRNLTSHQLTTSTNMIPQGSVTAGRYQLTTAYDATGQTQSVLYVQDRYRHQLRTTVILRGKPHVGGIAYDATHHRIWLCSHRHGHGALVSISLTALRQFDPTTSAAVHYQQRWLLPDLTNASLLTYHHHALYVGQFKSGQRTQLVRYPLTAAGKLTSQTAGNQSTLPQAMSDWHGSLPPNIQGLAFYHHYLLLSQSHGTKASHLFLFKVDQRTQRYRRRNAVAAYRLPPQLEQISIHQKRAQLLYETGAAPYRHQQTHPIDRLISIELPRLID
ncbi:hypothetical protein [Lactiplantibacillus paraplantarum]|uniref:hypothetical protein n=1 Tax=Lactiplantibacillus paraplantarum TaxID=60520 RepID=UPI0020735D47|nr:hypothetical protein [Lactiplantibacillus paraplantarum]